MRRKASRKIIVMISKFNTDSTLSSFIRQKEKSGAGDSNMFRSSHATTNQDVNLNIVAFFREGASGSLDDGTGGVVTGTYTLCNRLLQNKLREETSHESISSTVGIYQKLSTKKIKFPSRGPQSE